jgi:hypothetical protein
MFARVLRTPLQGTTLTPTCPTKLVRRGRTKRITMMTKRMKKRRRMKGMMRWKLIQRNSPERTEEMTMRRTNM